MPAAAMTAATRAPSSCWGHGAEPTTRRPRSASRPVAMTWATARSGVSGPASSQPWAMSVTRPANLVDVDPANVVETVTTAPTSSGGNGSTAVSRDRSRVAEDASGWESESSLPWWMVTRSTRQDRSTATAWSVVRVTVWSPIMGGSSCPESDTALVSDHDPADLTGDGLGVECAVDVDDGPRAGGGDWRRGSGAPQPARGGYPGRYTRPCRHVY